jgi:esterase/lipase
MGALLALHLARQRAREVRAVVALAPAIRLREQGSAERALWLRFLPRLPRRFEIVPKRRPVVGARVTPAYGEIPLRALASMIELQRVVTTELPLVVAPALVLAGDLDETIAPNAAEDVERALGSTTKRRLTFPRTGHIMTEDADAPAVLAAVEGFLEDHLRSADRVETRAKGEAER